MAGLIGVDSNKAMLSGTQENIPRVGLSNMFKGNEGPKMLKQTNKLSFRTRD